MKDGKIIVVSAPSGSGKSTIINSILNDGDIDMQFSVSATNRPPREGEVDGVNYNFLTIDEFKRQIDTDGFVEWEEVYPGRYYGTLKSEIERILKSGHNVILDIDVKGAINVKRIYGDRAILIFVKPPSIDALRDRLMGRGSETEDSLNQRLRKAQYELGFAPQFDTVIVNDKLPEAIDHMRNAIQDFIK